MKCKVCNSELRNGFKFCPMCGEPIEEPKPENELKNEEDLSNYPDGFNPKLYDL